jgi:D-glycero-alpha-D-manno-heptose 1-phosphate guanylyltransferase
MPTKTVIHREAVVLAGGLGTRLRSVISDVPKAMAPVNGRPFLEHLLTFLRSRDIRRVVLSIGYLGEHIRKYFGSTFGGMEIDYHAELTPLGTGGALQRALLRCVTDHVYVLNGDTFANFTCEEAEARHASTGRPVMFGKAMASLDRYGVLNLVGTQVHGINHRPSVHSGYINTGVYFVSTDILSSASMTPPFSFERDFLPAYLTSSPFEMVPVLGDFIDIGIPSDYHKAQSLLRFASL